MKMIYLPDTLQETNGELGARIGGKGMALFKLYNAGFPVARPICIGTSGYELFVERNQLREKINLELHRKDIKEMRWEEIWDISLRIQNLFLSGVFPEELHHEIRNLVRGQLGDKPLVIRSSAPEEDSQARSFAGLHESYLNVIGLDEMLKKIKKVWASLWSDRAILYRQELGLDVVSSKMAIVLQEFIEGESSGVLFSKSPLDSSQLIVEAVHGLNQGLVDGIVEPDRWILERKNRRILTHSVPEKRDFQFVRSRRLGVQRLPVSETMQNVPPLKQSQVKKIAALGLTLENFFGVSQDVEWTLVADKIHILQSRPITTEGGEDSTDKRSWYLSLTRSYDNLLLLWKSIAKELLPEMDRQSGDLAQISLKELSESELADELGRRAAINNHWVSIYWSDFIPFAHGVRLFGELYNDIVEPDDPFEFVSLLTGQNMLGTDRNRILYECAEMVRTDDSLRRSLEGVQLEKIADKKFQEKLALLKSSFSMDGLAAGEKALSDAIISTVILQYTTLDTFPAAEPPHDTRELETLFLKKGERKLPIDPKELLEMARASYRIRDDDNIHLGRIAQELERASAHARKRMRARGHFVAEESTAEDLAHVLKGGETAEKCFGSPTRPSSKVIIKQRVQARQLLGQPASRGLAKGRARVIASGAELKDFKKGEILVIDSIDPTLTFFAPLAAGIIERRGGMLIHGAIIAREYGIPCITGVVEATSYIRSGDLVTVDAYLGICTVQRSSKKSGSVVHPV
jgi:phosphoenolpyruvate synthase/pyruvate phosphate dikinase